MNIIKKAGRLMMSVVLVAGTILSHASLPICAAHQSDKTVIDGLCTGSIINPVGLNRCYVWYGDCTAFPKGDDAKYRVLSKSTTEFGGETMLLDCDVSIKFDMAHCSGDRYEYGENGWANSDINAWLNGDEFYENESVFSKPERETIATSVKLAPSSSDGPGEDEIFYYQPLTGEHIFLLDVKEVTNVSYGFPYDPDDYSASGCNGRDKDQDPYLLRSPGKGFYTVSRGKYIFTDGSSYCGGVGLVDEWEVCAEVTPMGARATNGISPAFNLNLTSILFTSLISGTAGRIKSEYKLTVKDPDLGTQTGRITKEGDVITVPYTITGANRNNATQLSVLIMEDSPYVAGKAATSGFDYIKLSVDSWGIEGTGTFTLPAKYKDKEWGSDYFVYILAEDVNGTYETDYASEPLEIRIIDKLEQINTSEQIYELSTTKSETQDYAAEEDIFLSPDYLDSLYSMLEDAIEAGGEQTIYWNQGTALPYDIMKLLEEHPNITLVFSYSYQGNDYKVSISGKTFKADPKIEWYGPVCLYSLFGGASISTSASANPTSLGNRTYTVISGDTLSKIAADLHVSVGELTRINNITNPNYIRIGQIIRY